MTRGALRLAPAAADHRAVSAPARQAVLVIVAAVLLVVLLTQRGPGSTPGEDRPKLDPFPEKVVAQATRLPQYADGPWTRVRQQLASLDAMWTAAFAAAGDRYERPRLVQRAECGEASTGWAGIYCGRTRSIAIDLEAHVGRHVATGGGLSDLVLGYVMAHEVGPHVQTLRGAPAADTLRRELHADCLAGVWGKASGLPLPPTWAYGEDAEHGTAAQRIHWLNEGYRNARPADCDALWVS